MNAAVAYSLKNFSCIFECFDDFFLPRGYFLVTSLSQQDYGPGVWSAHQSCSRTPAGTKRRQVRQSATRPRSTCAESASTAGVILAPMFNSLCASVLLLPEPPSPLFRSRSVRMRLEISMFEYQMYLFACFLFSISYVTGSRRSHASTCRTTTRRENDHNHPQSKSIVVLFLVRARRPPLRVFEPRLWRRAGCRCIC